MSWIKKKKVLISGWSVYCVALEKTEQKETSSGGKMNNKSSG